MYFPMLKREKYLEEIKELIDVDLVKVFIGMRRTGKTQLMIDTIEELKNNGVNKKNILYISLESREYNRLSTYEQLDEIVYSFAKNHEERIYILIDEIQHVDGWEKSINSYRVDLDCDIYITGSNSKLLSSELSTYLAGRYIIINVYPFSFKEYLAYYKSKTDQLNKVDERRLFDEYFKYGGMPGLLTINKDRLKTNALKDIYNSIIVDDILSRHSIKDMDLFKRFVRYLTNSTGQTFSKTSITNYLKSENKKTSPITIGNYTEFLQEALYFIKLRRKDLIGKKELKTEEKYYLTDHGFHNAIVDDNNNWAPRILENIVFIELLRRDYEVHIGKIKDKEIDFLCERKHAKIYVQVTHHLSTPKTVEREFGNLEKVPDNYPKYVLSLDDIDMSRNGIIHMNIIEFLKDESI